MYPGAQVQLKWSAASEHVAPLRQAPASHTDSRLEQLGDTPGAPADTTMYC